MSAAAAAATLLLLRACATDAPPHLRTVAGQTTVPLLSTYTPTPAPTPVAVPSAMSLADGAVAPTAVPTALADSSLLANADPSATPKPRKHRTSAPTPAPTAAAADAPVTAMAVPVVPECLKPDLAVSLRTDAATYAKGVKPKLYIGILNNGASPCRVDLGSVNLSFTVRSGKDRIWSSRDCQGKGTHDIRTLIPGGQLWARSVWSQVRSKHGCPDGEAKARPGTYVVDGSAAGVPADKKVAFRVE